MLVLDLATLEKPKPRKRPLKRFKVLKNKQSQKHMFFESQKLMFSKPTAKGPAQPRQWGALPRRRPRGSWRPRRGASRASKRRATPAQRRWKAEQTEQMREAKSRQNPKERRERLLGRFGLAPLEGSW